MQANDPVFAQYQIVRDEIQKSIFVQYEVIRLAAVIMGSLLVFVPAIYSALGEAKATVLAVALQCLAFVSVSFAFIMGAGEIRIMRAAAFSNLLLNELVLKEHPEMPEELLWDNFVSKWNQHLAGKEGSWRYRERTYLAMPFIVIMALADTGATVLILKGPTLVEAAASRILLANCLAIGLQVLLLLVLHRLSRDLMRANQACKPPRRARAGPPEMLEPHR